MGATVKELKEQFRNELTGIFSPQEAVHMAWLIFNHLRGWSKTQMMLHEDTKLNDSEYKFIETALERLKNHEPVQYITGETEFFGLPFRVNTSVLIPRPETEELVEWILQEVLSSPSPRILDIGTGSGCIAVALASRLPQAGIEAWDVSADALEVARSNAENNGVLVQTQQVDILNAPQDLKGPYDIIVSNPPYVRNAEKVMIEPNVTDYEPHLALFVDDRDPLIFFRHIASFAWQALKPGGRLFFEINRDFGEATSRLLTSYGFENPEVKKDLSGNSRMVKVVKPVGRSEKGL